MKNAATNSTIVAVASVLVGVCVNSGANTAGLDCRQPGPFLRHAASSPGALLQDLSTDPLVRARYCRLYGLSPHLLHLAFSQIRQTSLSNDRAFRVHYVMPDGRIIYLVQRLQRGTSVFVLPDGEPFLTVLGGCPLGITAPPLYESGSDESPSDAKAEMSLFEPNMAIVRRPATAHSSPDQGTQGSIDEPTEVDLTGSVTAETAAEVRANRLGMREDRYAVSAIGRYTNSNGLTTFATLSFTGGAVTGSPRTGTCGRNYVTSPSRPGPASIAIHGVSNGVRPATPSARRELITVAEIAASFETVRHTSFSDLLRSPISSAASTPATMSPTSNLAAAALSALASTAGSAARVGGSLTPTSKIPAIASASQAGSRSNLEALWLHAQSNNGRSVTELMTPAEGETAVRASGRSSADAERIDGRSRNSAALFSGFQDPGQLTHRGKTFYSPYTADNPSFTPPAGSGSSLSVDDGTAAMPRREPGLAALRHTLRSSPSMLAFTNRTGLTGPIDSDQVAPARTGKAFVRSDASKSRKSIAIPQAPLVAPQISEGTSTAIDPYLSGDDEMGASPRRLESGVPLAAVQPKAGEDAGNEHEAIAPGNRDFSAGGSAAASDVAAAKPSGSHLVAVASRVVQSSLHGTTYPGMPAGAFLQYPAPDSQALLREVASNSVVCSRYARLYGITPHLVRLAFAKVRLESLPQDRILRVHYVHPGEVIGYKLRRVRRGTPVYVLPDGTPFLVRACGNPLQIHAPTLVLNRRIVHPTAGEPGDVPDFSETEPLGPVETGDADTAALLRSEEPTAEVFPPIAELTTTSTATTPTPTPGAQTTPEDEQAIGHITHYTNTNGLYLLPIAGLIAGLVSSQGSGPIFSANGTGPPHIVPIGGGSGSGGHGGGGGNGGHGGGGTGGGATPEPSGSVGGIALALCGCFFARGRGMRRRSPIL